MRTRQARQSASTTVYDDGPRSAGPADAAGADTLDLATLPSVELTSDIIRHLLENIQDGSAISKHEESSSSSSSSTSVPLQRPARKKTAKAAVPSKSDGAPLRELEMQQDGHNIYPSTTKHDRREKHTDGSTSADVLDSEAGADQREGAVGVTRRTCSHCGRLFKRASDCRRHERIHTNDKCVGSHTTLHTMYANIMFSSQTPPMSHTRMRESIRTKVSIDNPSTHTYRRETLHV